MERGFRSVFVDALDTVANLAIRERFGEQVSDRSEGPAEFANPATVTQPVNPSQYPGGQPRNVVGSFTLSPMVALAGGVALLVSGVVIARLLR